MMKGVPICKASLLDDVYKEVLEQAENFKKYAS